MAEKFKASKLIWPLDNEHEMTPQIAKASKPLNCSHQSVFIIFLPST